jgi:hypothetical protein
MYQPPGRRYAILFESVAGFDTPVATNTLGASRLMDCSVAVGDGIHLDDRRVRGRSHVAVELAERTFLLAHAGLNDAFDHHLAVRRDKQVDGLAFHDFHRAPGQRAGHADLVDAEGNPPDDVMPR